MMLCIWKSRFRRLLLLFFNVLLHAMTINMATKQWRCYAIFMADMPTGIRRFLQQSVIKAVKEVITTTGLILRRLCTRRRIDAESHCHHWRNHRYWRCNGSLVRIAKYTSL